jgi:hypothetical protein
MPEWNLQILRRLASLNLAPAREVEIADELAQHLEDRYQELLSRGETPEFAERAALEELCGEDLLARGLRHIERSLYPGPITPGKATDNFFLGVLQDFHYAFRMLGKSPGFAAVAILTLALGIGANTAIFTIVDAVLVRPLPFKDPSRLMMLREGLPEIGFPRITASAPDILFYEREQKSFDSIGTFQNETLDISGGTAEPERVIAARVSASTFPMLGVSPLIGRTYTEAETAPVSFIMLACRRSVGPICDRD